MISISIMISKDSIFLSYPGLLMSFMTLDDLKGEKQQQKQLSKSFCSIKTKISSFSSRMRLQYEKIMKLNPEINSKI